MQDLRAAVPSKNKDKKVRVVSVKEVRKATEEDFEEDSDPASPMGPPPTSCVRNLILRSLALIYFIAFFSVYLQADGLFGTNGVLPIKAELKLNNRPPHKCMSDKFSVICNVPAFFGIDSFHALDLTTLLGMMTSAVAVMSDNVCTLPVMTILWGLYYSIYAVGSTFLWFQWDILLLEAGILGILLAPWLPTRNSMKDKPRDLGCIWLVRWLLFRLMFASGVVKLQSGCPTWWGLSALNYHFESQCIPTPLAYYVHHLPSWLLHLGVVGTYYVEIATPIAFFAPFKALRKFAFWTQVIFQLAIIVTGNYTFFNILTIVLCFALLDSDYDKPKRTSAASKFFSRAFTFAFIGFSLFYTIKFFGLTLKQDKTLASQITFSRVEFDWFVSIAVPYASIMGLLSLGSTIAQSLVVACFDMRGWWGKLSSLFTCIFYGALCIAIFSISLVPFTSLHKETQKGIFPVVQDLHNTLQRYHIVNSYGLFRRMTGVEKGRPEVVLEYSDDLNGPWKEYHFLYKPGNVSATPVFVAPHQPRLDWQMWFAALGTYKENHWLMSLTYRLLTGEKAVENLLDRTRLPPNTPKYIRASLYHYKYSKQGSADWWVRKRDSEYMPVFSKDHAPLVDYVKGLGLLDEDVNTKPKSDMALMMTQTLDSIRGYVAVTPRPEYVLWGAVLALLAIIFTARIVQ